jgi:hypothetical protein
MISAAALLMDGQMDRWMDGWMDVILFVLKERNAIKVYYNMR